jgi:hypothetical protein
MVRKGQLVKPSKDARSPMLLHWPEPYVPGIIIKGPYEKAFSGTVAGMKSTTLINCVDVLLSSGEIISVPSVDLEKL